MGNQLAQPTKLQPEHLAELDDVVLKSMLGAGFGSSANSEDLAECWPFTRVKRDIMA